MKKKILDEIRNNLTVTPYINTNYNDNITKFTVYMENKNKMYLPKFYGLKKFGEPEFIKLPKGIDINIEFIFNLREEQKKPTQIAIDSYNKKGGGILHLQCGFGKNNYCIIFNC